MVRPSDRGNGRGGHDQDVRVEAFLPQRGALLDAEAMLLVDDGQPQASHLYAALDERMRADGNGALRRFSTPQASPYAACP